MPAYLSQIAAGASLAPAGSRPLAPTVRSRSPIAERDQRLGLTDADWSFEGVIATDETALPMPDPTDAAAPLVAGEVRADPVLAATAVSQEPAAAAAPRKVRAGALPSTTAVPRQSAAARIQPPIPREPQRRPPVAAPSEPESGLHERDAIPVENTSSKTRERVVGHATTGSTEREMPGTRMKNHPEADRPEAAARPRGIPPLVSSAEAHRASPPLGVTTVPRAPSRTPAEAPRPESGTPPAARPPRAAARQPAPATGSPGVIIGRIEVEVVPPPAEKAAVQPTPSPPARSGDVSQIGPLGGVARHLALAARYH